MTIQVNQAGLSKAKALIRAGKADKESAWSFSAADGNKLLGPDGDDWKNFASFHLAVDTEQEEETKARYKYPYGKNDKVYRRGVIAAKSRAAQQGEDTIVAAAESLLEMIDAETEEDACGTGAKKKKADQSRLDFLEPFDPYGPSKFEATPEGYLEGKAVLTTVGVYPYVTADGAVVWELRPPDEVYHPDSLASLKLQPIASAHPADSVGPDNVSKLGKGVVGENITIDPFQGHVIGTLRITDRDTIMGIKEGNRGISCGYKADIEDSKGVWNGVPYDAIQRNIRYNHVAVNIDKGRAGDAARIRMDHGFDSWNGVMCQQEKVRQDNTSPIEDKSTKEERRSETMKKVKIDGVEYEAEAKVIESRNDALLKVDELNVQVAQLNTEVEQLKKDNSTLEAERDSLKEEVTEAKKKLNAGPDQAKIDELVNNRIALLEVAKKASVEMKDGMDDLEVKRQVILKVSPEAKLDGKDGAYIQARFDAACERLDEMSKKDQSGEAALSGLTAPAAQPQGNGQPEVSSEKAREDMVNQLTNAWKPVESKQQ